MPKLTENEKRAFTRQLLEVLRNNATRLTGLGFSATNRITLLETRADEADVKEAAQRAAEETSLRATRESQEATDVAYDVASQTVELIIGLVGKKDELATVLRGIRGGMSQGGGGEGGEEPGGEE